MIGSEDSGKSALVHYFLTTKWSWGKNFFIEQLILRVPLDESPEGGRFKKLQDVDGWSWLLLIRDEGSRQPDNQVDTFNLQTCQFML